MSTTHLRALPGLAILVLAATSLERPARACCGDHDAIKPSAVIYWPDLEIALSFAEGTLGSFGDCTQVGVWSDTTSAAAPPCTQEALPAQPEVAALIPAPKPDQPMPMAPIVKRATARPGAVLLSPMTCPVRERRSQTATTLLLADAVTGTDLPWRTWDNTAPQQGLNPADEYLYGARHQWALRQCWGGPGGTVWIEMSHHSGNTCSSLTTPELFRFDPTRVDAHRDNTLGFRKLQAGDLPGARALFEQAVALDATLTLARFNLACTLARSGAAFADGKPHLDVLVAGGERARYLAKIANDKDLDPWRAVGLDAWLNEKRALEHQAPTTPRGKANLHNARGLALYQRKDLKGAAAAFEAAIGADPTLVVAYTNIASVRALQGDGEEALRVLEIAIGKNEALTLRKMRTDGDFDALRKDPRFQALFEGPP